MDIDDGEHQKIRQWSSKWKYELRIDSYRGSRAPVEAVSEPRSFQTTVFSTFPAIGFGLTFLTIPAWPKELAERGRLVVGQFRKTAPLLPGRSQRLRARKPLHTNPET